MKLIPWDLNEVMAKRKKRVPNRNSNVDILEEFLNSGIQCAKLEEYPQGSVHLCAASLQLSVKRYRYPIDVVSRGNEVFLINLEMSNVSNLYRDLTKSSF